jgi:hypothetical protein
MLESIILLFQEAGHIYSPSLGLIWSVREGFVDGKPIRGW